jgi:hypothetical protein
VYLTFDRVFFFIESPAFPPITGADDSNGFAAIGKTNHQNPARCATDANNRVSSALCSSSAEIKCFGSVEGGCRFAEIDAVLRKVRFFFLGIPFKSQPLNTGTIWDNINI